MYPDQISGRTQDKCQFACRPRSEAANLIYEICLKVVSDIQLRLRNLVISGRDTKRKILQIKDLQDL